MREIKAYVKSHKLPDLLKLLKEEPRAHHVSVLQNHIPVGLDEELDGLQDYIKVEIVCESADVDEIVEDIKTFARTGLRNDGKIYISTLGKAIDISDHS